MRKLLLILMLMPFMATAQNTFGYFNYNKVMQQLPQYEQAQADYNELLARCDSEIKRNEQELTRSYVAFLSGQYDFPEPILRKRQKELQDLVDRSVVFRELVKDWLKAAHDSLFYPIHAKIDSAVAILCVHNNLAYAIDCEQAGYKYINPAVGFDITDALITTILTGSPQRIIATGASENVAIKQDDEAAENAAGEDAATDETVGEAKNEETTNQ